MADSVMIDPKTGERVQPQIRTGATSSGRSGGYYAQGTSNLPNDGQISSVSTAEPNDIQIDPATGERMGPAGASGPLPGVPKPAPAPMQTNAAGYAVPAASALKDFGTGVAKGAGNTLTGIQNLELKYVPGLHSAGLAPTFTPDQLAPSGTAQKIGKTAEQVGEFFVPGPAEDAALTKLAPYVGEAAPLLKAGLAAAGTGTLNKLQGGDFTTGAIAGGVGSGVSQGLQKIAPTLAESALGVTGLNRMYGREVGRAILDDTTGIRPATIEDSARATIGKLKPQMEQIAAFWGNAGARGSLTPALDSVDSRIANHVANRAINSASELKPLKTFLQTDAVTGRPLAPAQAPTGLLHLKRGLDADFIGNWNPTRNTNNELEAAKSAYGKLADEYHAAAPGTQDLDQRISSLIPVAERANRTSLGAGVVQNTLNRLRTPTGALVGSIAGGEEGYRRGGLPAALGGAALGAVAPALIGSPEAQMFVARTANGIGPRLVVPVIGGGFQLKRN